MIRQGTPVREGAIMPRGSGPQAGRLTVGALEAYLAEHDVPPDAEVRLRRLGEVDTAGITATWDPRAHVLVLDEGPRRPAVDHEEEDSG
jgi:hypothetical protein